MAIFVVLLGAPAVIVGLLWLVVLLEVGGERPEHELLAQWWW